MACRTLSLGQRQQRARKIERLRDQLIDSEIMIEDHRIGLESSERLRNITVVELARAINEYNLLTQCDDAGGDRLVGV